MAVGVLIKHSRLGKTISSLDFDEGMRIESSDKNKKIFINRSPSGNFVVQFGEKEFYYFQSVAPVLRLAKKMVGRRYSAWKY